MDEEYVYCDDNKNPIYFKYLLDTRNFKKTMDLSGEWFEAHDGYMGIINTNNYHEAEYERSVLEYRIKQYGLNREDFQEGIDYYDELIEAGKRHYPLAAIYLRKSLSLPSR